MSPDHAAAPATREGIPSVTRFGSPIESVGAWRNRARPGAPAGASRVSLNSGFYNALQYAGLKVYPQQMVSSSYGHGFDYCADLAYYDASCGLRIDIEVDGSFKDTDPRIQANMARRDRRFTELGWHVLRFHALDAYSDAAACVRFIKQYVATEAVAHRAVSPRSGLRRTAAAIAQSGGPLASLASS